MLKQLFRLWQTYVLAGLLWMPAACALGQASGGESGADSGASEAKLTLGWLQSIRLQPYAKRLTAKLDTGAKSSTIHALDIEYYRVNGTDYVRFIIPVPEKRPDKKNEQNQIKFELPVVRKLRIKQHDGRPADERAVVKLDFCLNRQVHTAEFSLDNRQHFNYPVLLGRNFLKGRFIIDPELKFLYRSYCP